MVPELATERLILRAHRTDDLREYAAIWGDPQVTRHIGGRPFSSEECWHRLMRNAGHWVLIGYGYWIIEDRATHRVLGEVGFADLKRTIDPPFDGAPEMGWVLGPYAHGKGLATEAVGAGLDWARATWGPRRLVCMIAPDNAPSLRVAEKTGFREYARTSYHDSPSILLERRG